MTISRRLAGGAALWGFALTVFVSVAEAAAAPPKYFFKTTEIDAGPGADPALAALARELLEEDLKGRPEFVTDVETAGDDAELRARLAKRGLRGFGVSLKIEEKSVLRPPRPGGRLKVLALGVRVALVGATVGEDKLAFSGDGEAEAESEIVEQRRDKEIADLRPDVLRQALKQAVDQAIAKLALGKARPFNEARGKRARGKK